MASAPGLERAKRMQNGSETQMETEREIDGVKGRPKMKNVPK